MSSLKFPTLNHQISQEAAEWLVEFRTGDIDAAGRKAFDAWLRGSPEHLRAFIEMAAIWNEGAKVDSERRVDLEGIVARAREEVKVVSLEEPHSQDGATETADRRERFRSLALAASVVAVCVGAALLSWQLLRGQGTYVTEAGEQRSLTLADGSTVMLDSRSALRVAFTKGERLVDLQTGQALFHVAKDAARPFIVRAGNTSVRAVGTVFDVDEKQAGTVITVVEGRVAVGPQTSILVAAGEQVAVTRGATAAPKRKPANVASATAWTQGHLIFDSASLEEVAEAFNRYSARKLIVEDRGATALRLSGVFATRPDFLIRYLSARPDITIRETATEVHIVRHDPAAGERTSSPSPSV